MQIIGHRGLHPARRNFPSESSREAFVFHLQQKYGVEFDVRPTRDKRLIIMHDKTLARMTNGRDTRPIAEVTMQEFFQSAPPGNTFIAFSDLIKLINKWQASGCISALHLKKEVQTDSILRRIHEELSGHSVDDLLIFDVTLASAKQLKAWNPRYRLAPSVAHPHDIERYNEAVGGTLYPLEHILKNRHLFDWVWLDEWDRTGAGVSSKTLYARDVFDVCRKAGLKIAVISPELHGTSPGLLGGEAHQDAQSLTGLVERWKQIIDLEPDAICTDFPDFIRSML